MMHFEASPSSSTSSTPSSSPSTSPSHPQVSIGFTPNGTDALLDIYPRDRPSSTGNSCAFPSWPQRSTFSPFGASGAPSSFISDEDLFCGELPSYGQEEARSTSGAASSSALSAAAYLLSEAPAPPRQHLLPTTLPLAPLYASARPKKRRSPSKKQRRPSKPMTPISESPETPE